MTGTAGVAEPSQRPSRWDRHRQGQGTEGPGMTKTAPTEPADPVWLDPDEDGEGQLWFKCHRLGRVGPAAT
jgi:hypothetical protein